jgi:hypothetical protein
MTVEPKPSDFYSPRFFASKSKKIPHSQPHSELKWATVRYSFLLKVTAFISSWVNLLDETEIRK